MTADELRNVTFDQARKGYRTEDVDDYLSQVADAMEQLEAELEERENEIVVLQQGQSAQAQIIEPQEPAVQEDDSELLLQLQAAQELAVQLQERVDVLEGEKYQLAEATSMALAAKEEAESKMLVLAEKAEEYRGQEETLKSTLINAQRLGDTVVNEAKQKAEQMLREATGQTELLRQRAEQESARERQVLEGLVSEVGKFKTTVLNLYKQHIESLSAMDAPVNRAEDYLAKEKEGKPVLISEEPAAAEADATLAEAMPGGSVSTIINNIPNLGGSAQSFGGAPLEEKK